MAAHWQARLADASNPHVETEFERWRDATPENRAAYERVAARQDDLRTLADAPEILSLRHQTLVRLALKRRSDGRVKTALGAALVILLVGLPILALYSGVDLPYLRRGAVEADAKVGESFRTAVGQRLTLPLADGSRVTLNTASRIRVGYTNRARSVTLEAGQAWFEVAKDSSRPFIVHAGGERVVAHGTAFDVRIMPDRTEVMLAEGKVSVDSERSGGGGAGIAMKANQLLVASATGTTLRSVANASAWKNWRDGIVKFDNLPLAQAVAEMNRYSETQLEVADAATGRIVVSGAFNTGSTQAFVEALAIGFRVTSREEGEGKIVLKYVG